MYGVGVVRAFLGFGEVEEWRIVVGCNSKVSAVSVEIFRDVDHEVVDGCRVCGTFPVAAESVVVEVRCRSSNRSVERWKVDGSTGKVYCVASSSDETAIVDKEFSRMIANCCRRVCNGEVETAFVDSLPRYGSY